MLTGQLLVLGWGLGVVLTDVKTRRIPNALSLGAGIFGLGYAIVTGHALLGANWLDLVLGLLLAGLLTVPAYLQRRLGAADVKLLLAIALLGGWKCVLISFIVAGLLGGLGLMAMLQYSNYFARPMPAARWLPFGALLAVGFITSMGARW